MKKLYNLDYVAVFLFFLFFCYIINPELFDFYKSEQKKNNIKSIDYDADEKENLHSKNVISEFNISELNIDMFDENTNTSIKNFINKLKSNNSQIRIAHFGDSMIEGDLITQNLRRALQKKYGVGGIGFIPITTEAPHFRGTIKHSFSNNWKRYSLLTNKPSECKYGISGYVFKTTTEEIEPADYPYVEYNILNDKSDKVRLFYSSNTSDYELSYILNDGEATRMNLSPTENIGEVVIDLQHAKKIRLVFAPNPDLVLYGVSFESDQGVIVDNFPIRGHSGLLLTKINQSIINQFNNLLDYDLIIMQYGTNVTDDKMQDFSWYEKGLVNVIEHFKNSMVNTPILIVSTTDRAFKNANGLYSSPSVTKIVDAQLNASKKTQTAFWNLYESMGGEKSIIRWKEKDLASADYIHLNHKGAEKVADLLYNVLSNKLN